MYTLALVNGQPVYVDLDSAGNPVIPPPPPASPAGPGLDYPPGQGPSQGLVQGMTDGSEVVRPLAQLNNPGGNTDDAQIINDSLARCGVTRLIPGARYSISSPIIVPSSAALLGPFPVQADSNSSYGANLLPVQAPVIAAAGPYTSLGGPPPAMIQCVNNSASSSVQQGPQTLANFSLEGNTTPATSGVFGIQLLGAVGAGLISGVTVHRTDGALLRVQLNATSGKSPDQWRVENCVFAASRSSHGVQVDSGADFDWINCLSHNNALDGWNEGSGTNTNWFACRGENNGGTGFHFTGPFGAGTAQSLTGCSTQLNQGSGYLFDSSTSSLGITYHLTGCRSVTDGQAAVATDAGFLVSGCKSMVMLTGCIVTGNATGPAYGISQVSGSFGTYYAGFRGFGVKTAATRDDASNTNALTGVGLVAF